MIPRNTYHQTLPTGFFFPDRFERKFNLYYICMHIYYLCRSARAEEPIWGEDEGFSDHDYYNSIPGKEPPIGGVVDTRLRGSGALLGHVHSQPQGYTTAQVTLQTDSVNCASLYYCYLIWMHEPPHSWRLEVWWVASLPLIKACS